MFDDIVATSSPEPPDITVSPEEDTAIMLYTGGTTGVPKGAELTHTNFTYNLEACEEYFRLVHEPGKKAEKMRHGGYHTYLGVLPWYHSFGITSALLFSALSGSPAHLYSGSPGRESPLYSSDGSGSEIPAYLYHGRAHHLCGLYQPPPSGKI